MKSDKVIQKKAINGILLKKLKLQVDKKIVLQAYQINHFSCS